jgi:prenylated cyclic peptide (anacyclamide/piricyclamide family)
MTKKNLKPQQSAPVQREINTSSSAEGGTGLTPLAGAVRGSDTPRADTPGMEDGFGILLRATTRSNPPDSNTHLKKCQKPFSVSLGARFASIN